MGHNMQKWRTGLEARVETHPQDFDGQTVFEKCCRQPGTRINWIMTRIEQGWTDEDIAAKAGTTARVIAVYRKALTGTLCVIETSHGNPAETYDKISFTYKRVGYMHYSMGMTRSAIAQALGISDRRVRTCLERYRNKMKEKGK